MYLTTEQTHRLLQLPDLTQPSSHCIAQWIDHLQKALAKAYTLTPQIERGSPIVTVQDNYHALGYQPDEVTLSTRYTKYLDEHTLLRTQMTSVIPSLLRQPLNGPILWMCPGQVYRRDVRDRTHVGEPHQMDLWYLTPTPQTRHDLLRLVSVIIQAMEQLKGASIAWRYHETHHHYTDEGIEVEIEHQGQWLELLECGLAGRLLLDQHGHTGYSGLALGMGLDRLVMIIKGIEDIRVLSSTQPEIAQQMTHWSPYRVISKQPAITRDLSLAVDSTLTEEALTERLLEVIGPHSLLEQALVLSETPYNEVPEVGRQRLGMLPQHKNVLLRIVLRDLVRTLTKSEANQWYTLIYSALHEGQVGYSI